ncbi:MAG: SCO7613 C-terminal domain-containing membrane protein [Nocardioidaceae bacterium]
MTRFADPGRCPDCGAAITPGAPACTGCGLSLSGDVARELFTTLTHADQLLSTLRAASVPTRPLVGAGASTGPTGPTGPALPPGLQQPLPLAEAPRPRLSGASVPKILLGLGAACLLVAALVFLAVTWSVMGVGGRTATLVGFTIVTGGLAGWLARRGLRAATESLGLVSLGLFALDVVGAEHAGWLGDLSPATFRFLLGALLVAAAATAAVAVRRTPARGFGAAEVVAGAGAALLAEGLGSSDWLPRSPALVLAVLAAAGTTLALRRVGLRVATALAAAVTGAVWLVLTAHSLARAGEHQTVAWVWGHAEGWPLLAAAALASVPALVRSVPHPARVAAAGTGYLVLTVALALPALDQGPTDATLAALVALAVSAGVTAVVPRGWRYVPAGVQGLAGAVCVVVSMVLGLVAVQRVVALVDPPWSSGFGVRLAPSEHSGPAPWLLPLCVAALVGTAVLLARGTDVLRPLRPTALAVVAVVIGTGAVLLTLVLYPVPGLAVVATALLAAVVLAGVALQRRSTTWLVVAGLALVPALVPALAAASLTVIVAATALVLADTAQLRATVAAAAEGAGLLTATALAGTAATTAHLLDAAGSWSVLVGLLALAAAVLAPPYAPDRWWATPAARARTGVEVGAAAVAVPLATAGALLAPGGEAATWTAVYLTLAGAVTVAMALLRQDRRALGWVGGALLAAASWVRLGDIGVREPEPYTLPAATALLVVGLVHLRRNPAASTVTALGPALGLALVPTLLWALADPVSLRSLLLGLACLGLVVAGARLRWTAPMTFGAAAGSLLLLRLAAPYIGHAVPRWVLIGTAGAVLVLMGVTWERRLTEARHAVAYLRRLR